MTTNTTTTKTDALAAFLECDPDEITQDRQGNFNHRSKEYLVLTEDEADAKAAEEIRNSVWAFTEWFIADHTPDGITADHIDTLRGDSCEGCNDAMTALVEAGTGMDRFISDAISADGLGHFLAHYDHEENDSPCGQFLIFRIH